MKERALSLDALRGYAIITMVLSATIAMGILPAWMYHAQVPPPDHVFNPNIPGLTWVDLVFPTFLFAMGAAFPFSIGKKFAKGVSKLKLSLNALWRGVLLTYFAIFIQHFYPYMTGDPQDMRSWLLAILCFAMLFPIYMRMPFKMPTWAHWVIQIGSMIIGAIIMLTIKYPHGDVFDMHTSNIIILILANMAVFASLLYIFTINKPKLRIAILMMLFALMLSASVEGSWSAKLAAYSPLTWFFHFNYLKYLFIVIPGSFAGEILAKWMEGRAGNKQTLTGRRTAWLMIIITLSLVIINLYCLYMRLTVLNMMLTLALIAVGFSILYRQKDFGDLWRRLFVLGSFILTLGLLMEPFEGGIKKDPVTLSYLFTTAGLSFMTLIFFSAICDYFKCHKATSFLVMSGQNPMVAYVAGDLLIIPLLQICGVWAYMGIFYSSQLTGFLQGVLMTSLAVLVTMFFTKIKWLWRT